MRIILLAYLLIFSNIILSQNNNWMEFSKEKKITIDINKTKIYKIDNLNFDVIWDNELDYSENIWHYGGIKRLDIYKKDKKLQEINNVADKIALGYISFRFYDYNFDGYLDFTLPINSRWEMYFIFNA